MPFKAYNQGMTAESYPNLLLALCLWREARGQTIEAKRAVLHVILNRAAQGFRGHDPVSVVLWPWQFSSFNASDANSRLLPNPKQVMDWKAWLDCCAVVDEPGEDPTGGVVMYESEPDPAKRPPWATPEKLSVTVGPFRFYRA